MLSVAASDFPAQEASLNQLLTALRRLLRDALATSAVLFRIIVPVAIITRLLELVGAVDQLGILLAPVMDLVGLPGEMGLVWATTLITNLYGGMIVFAALAPGLSLSVAQVTVLTTMMLVAHALPVELRIAQKAGPRFRVMVLLRLGGALLLGMLLHHGYRLSGTLQGENRALWQPPPRDPSWLGWGLAQVQTLATIFLIILLLMALLRGLERIGLMAWVTRLFAPLLGLLGIHRAATPVTLIGMTLGLSYGGALIIQEARSGQLAKRDVFFSLALMGLCHSLIEDTLVMMVLGGHLSGILFARALFALAVVRLLVLGLRRMPDAVFDRWLFRA